MTIFKSKKNTIIIFAIILCWALFFMANIYLDKKVKEENKSDITDSAKQAEYNTLTPGQSTTVDMKDELGEPLDSNSEENTTLYEYESSTPNRNNEIYVQDDKIYFIKEIITSQDTKKMSDYITSYGKPRYRLYGSHSASGFDLYAYPTQGVAFIGEPKSDLLIEIWYFSPTSYEEFKTKYASGYTEEYEPIQ